MSWSIETTGNPLDVVAEVEKVAMPQVFKDAVKLTAAEIGQTPGWLNGLYVRSVGHIGGEFSNAQFEARGVRLAEPLPQAPQPAAPPVSNENVAPGCEQFAAPNLMAAVPENSGTGTSDIKDA